MTEGEEVLAQASAWAGQGLGVALATVTSTWGSALRPAGSLLAVNARGEFTGSVSGGCVEAAVVEEALQAIADGRLRRPRYGVSDERAWSLGLACGGTVEVLVERLDGASALAPLLAEVRERRPVVRVSDLASGAARLLRPGEGEEPLAAAAREAAAQDRSALWQGPGGAAFLRVFQPPVRVFVVGAVHVAQALAPMLQLAGYDVLVVDPRRAFGAEARFPGIALSHEWPEEAFARAGLDRRSAVVTLTHDPKIDEPALAAALRSEAFYVGALGSRRTQADRRARLAAEGLAEAQLDRIHGPVGLAIGAISPGEIAASILAELVRCLRRPAG